MWQKADPRGLRVGVSQPWPCEWFAQTKRERSEFLVEDLKIRNFIEDYFYNSGIWKVVIRKTKKEWEIIIFTAKPAVVIWKEWKNLQKFQNLLNKKFGREYKINIKELKNPEFFAKIMAEYISDRLAKRVPYKRVAKSVVEKVMEKWALGVKIQIGWRLWWVDLSRSEKFIKWRIPLQTLRADVDFHAMQAHTKYWVLWVKVWIYKWDIDMTNNKKKWAKSSRRKMNNNRRSQK